MNKSKTVIKNSLKFWSRLREIQASQPTEENVCPYLNMLQNAYYKKHFENSLNKEESNKDKNKLSQ